MVISRRFIESHFGTTHKEFGSEFFIEFRLIRNGKARSYYCKYPAIDQMLPKVLKMNQDGWDAYFGVNPRPLSRRKTEKDIEVVTCLFADVDVGKGRHYQDKNEALKAIRDFPAVPSSIVSSGSGVHCYWLLKEPVSINDAKDRLKIRGILSGIIKALHADKSGCSLERVLRLPGTINHKYGKRCEVEEWNYERTSKELFD